MIKFNTQPHTDGGDVLRQYVTALADGVKQDRLQAAVADLETQFIKRRGIGLFIDAPQRINTAQAWAAMMDTRHHTRAYTQWLAAGYVTGRWFGYHVILFPITSIDGIAPAGFFAYRLTGDNFGATAKWFTAPEWIELNQKGKLVPDAEPLPLGGCCNPPPGAVEQYRRDWRALRRFKQSHGGRSPEEQAAYEERRRRWRGDNNQDNNDNQSKED